MNISMIYQTSAPGSIMLFGEHAVLHGHLAIACAVNQRMTVTLIPSVDKKIELISDRLGRHSTHLGALEISKPFDFLLTAIKRYQNELPSGFTLKITSEFSHQVGLGSSAAITVAGIAVLNQWMGRTLNPRDLFTESLSVVHSVQGTGSGTDIAASVFGGLIAYRQEPFFIEHLNFFPEISLIYAGYKTPTADVIKKVIAATTLFPYVYKNIFNCIGACSEAALKALHHNETERLGELFFIQQQLMQALGVSDSTLNAIIEILKTDPGIINAKISGSGLGDCIVSLGKISNANVMEQLQKLPGIRIIDIQISDKGISYAST